MAHTLRALYLMWLPIAVLCLVIPVKGQDNAHHVYARSALAREIANLQAEYGDSIDTSLDGYDHELVATTLKEAQRKRSVAEAKDELAKEASVVKAQYGSDIDKIDLSLDGYDIGDFDDYDEDTDDDEAEAPNATSTTQHKRSVPATQATSLAQEASAIKADFSNNKIDLYLDGYDLNAIAEDGDDVEGEDDETLEVRDITGSADSDDLIGHIYSRSAPLKNYEHIDDKAEFGGHVHSSLDGYRLDDLNAAAADHVYESSPLSRRDNHDDDGNEEDNPATSGESIVISPPQKSDFSPGVDFSLHGYDIEGLVRRHLKVEEDDNNDDLDQYLTSWDAEVRKRDFPDDDNDRYHEKKEEEKVGEDEDEIFAAQATAAADAARENVRRTVETAEEEVKNWYFGVKRWLGRPEQ